LPCIEALIAAKTSSEPCAWEAPKTHSVAPTTQKRSSIS
jgi:hypothetical protein